MNLEFTNGGSFATNSGLFTATGAETVYDTTVIIEFSIDGIGYRKAAVADGVTPTTDLNTSAPITLTANKARSVLWCLNSAGTVFAVAGPIVTWDGGTSSPDYGFAPNQVPAFGNVPTGYAPFAASLIKAGSTTSGTWTFGSSNWNATGLTVTHKNLIGFPSRPILV